MFYKFSINIDFTKFINNYGNFFPEEFASILLSKVVLPDPKKPVSMVIGVFMVNFYKVITRLGKFVLRALYS